MTGPDLALSALAAFPLAAAAYLALLALASRRERPPIARPPQLRFDVVVPGHDEESGIAETVRSLLRLDYPAPLFRVLVVADNCTDATAQRAREAGATVVLERVDPANRGKGFALAHAFERVQADGLADAVVVIDADTTVDRQLLRAFSARLERGALAIQAEYQVRAANDTWRTRLLHLALALFHTTRSLGRERLHLSCGLRGNGMCFAREVLGRVPYCAFSIVEDLEYGLRLGEAGVRVAFAGEVAVRGEMPSGEQASRSQRRRWEGGRRQLRRELGLAMLARALRRRNALLLDLSLDLLIPPLATVVGALIAVAALGAASALAGWPVPVALSMCAASAILLGLYALRGWWLSRTGLRGLADLARAPLYLLWKLTLSLRPDPAGRGEWVRTAREGEARR